MKNLILTATLVTSAGIVSAQTNRINHYAHSGSESTLNVFAANDNMGLGCGSSSYIEFTPDTTKILDSVFLNTPDSVKVCTPKTTTPDMPRRGMSLERKFDFDEMVGRGTK